MLINFLVKRYTKDGKDINCPEVRAKIGKASGIVGIICNILLFAAKLFAGIISFSVAIIADAINNISDASSNIVSFFGFKLASRPADKEHPYGHGRYEYLAALTVALLIMVIGVELMRTGIEKIIAPQNLVVLNAVTIAIMCASIIIKLWLCLFYSRLGKKINSNALIAASADSRNDVIATSVVLVTAIISHFIEIELDGYMTVAVALFVLYSGFCLVKDTLNPLLGKAPDEELCEDIRLRILAHEGVLGTHDLMVHDYGVGRQFASVHIEVDADLGIVAAHEICDAIERDFLESDNLHMVVHLDPIAHDDEEGKIRNFILGKVKNFNGNLTIHDLKILRCNEKRKCFFDCVIPKEFEGDEAELVEKIKLAIKLDQPDLECEITIDKNFAALPHQKR